MDPRFMNRRGRGIRGPLDEVLTQYRPVSSLAHEFAM